MNEEYLKGLHNHLGINDDYDTWVGAIKDNNEYKTNMHKNLGVDDDFDTWNQAIFGVKKKDHSSSSTENGDSSGSFSGDSSSGSGSGNQDDDDPFVWDRTIFSNIDGTSSVNFPGGNVFGKGAYGTVPVDIGDGQTMDEQFYLSIDGKLTHFKTKQQYENHKNSNKEEHYESAAIAPAFSENDPDNFIDHLIQYDGGKMDNSSLTEANINIDLSAYENLQNSIDKKELELKNKNQKRYDNMGLFNTDGDTPGVVNVNDENGSTPFFIPQTEDNHYANNLHNFNGNALDPNVVRGALLDQIILDNSSSSSKITNFLNDYEIGDGTDAPGYYRRSESEIQEILSKANYHELIGNDYQAELIKGILLGHQSQINGKFYGVKNQGELDLDQASAFLKEIVKDYLTPDKNNIINSEAYKFTSNEKLINDIADVQYPNIENMLGGDTPFEPEGITESRNQYKKKLYTESGLYPLEITDYQEFSEDEIANLQNVGEVGDKSATEIIQGITDDFNYNRALSIQTQIQEKGTYDILDSKGNVIRQGSMNEAIDEIFKMVEQNDLLDMVSRYEGKSAEQLNKQFISNNAILNEFSKWSDAVNSPQWQNFWIKQSGLNAGYKPEQINKIISEIEMAMSIIYSDPKYFQRKHIGGEKYPWPEQLSLNEEIFGDEAGGMSMALVKQFEKFMSMPRDEFGYIVHSGYDPDKDNMLAYYPNEQVKGLYEREISRVISKILNNYGIHDGTTKTWKGANALQHYIGDYVEGGEFVSGPIDDWYRNQIPADEYPHLFNYKDVMPESSHRGFAYEEHVGTSWKGKSRKAERFAFYNVSAGMDDLKKSKDAMFLFEYWNDIKGRLETNYENMKFDDILFENETTLEEIKVEFPELMEHINRIYDPNIQTKLENFENKTYSASDLEAFLSNWAISNVEGFENATDGQKKDYIADIMTDSEYVEELTKMLRASELEAQIPGITKMLQYQNQLESGALGQGVLKAFERAQGASDNINSLYRILQNDGYQKVINNVHQYYNEYDKLVSGAPFGIENELGFFSEMFKRVNESDGYTARFKNVEYSMFNSNFQDFAAGGVLPRFFAGASGYAQEAGATSLSEGTYARSYTNNLGKMVGARNKNFSREPYHQLETMLYAFAADTYLFTKGGNLLGGATKTIGATRPMTYFTSLLPSGKGSIFLRNSLYRMNHSGTVLAGYSGLKNFQDQLMNGKGISNIHWGFGTGSQGPGLLQDTWSGFKTGFSLAAISQTINATFPAFGKELQKIKNVYQYSSSPIPANKTLLWAWNSGYKSVLEHRMMYPITGIVWDGATPKWSNKGAYALEFGGISTLLGPIHHGEWTPGALLEGALMHGFFQITGALDPKHRRQVESKLTEADVHLLTESLLTKSYDPTLNLKIKDKNGNIIEKEAWNNLTEKEKADYIMHQPFHNKVTWLLNKLDGNIKINDLVQFLGNNTFPLMTKNKVSNKANGEPPVFDLDGVVAKINDIKLVNFRTKEGRQVWTVFVSHKDSKTGDGILIDQTTFSTEAEAQRVVDNYVATLTELSEKGMNIEFNTTKLFSKDGSHIYINGKSQSRYRMEKKWDTPEFWKDFYAEGGNITLLTHDPALMQKVNNFARKHAGELLKDPNNKLPFSLTEINKSIRDKYDVGVSKTSVKTSMMNKYYNEIVGPLRYYDQILKTGEYTYENRDGETVTVKATKNQIGDAKTRYDQILKNKNEFLNSINQVYDYCNSLSTKDLVKNDWVDTFHAIRDLKETDFFNSGNYRTEVGNVLSKLRENINKSNYKKSKESDKYDFVFWNNQINGNPEISNKEIEKIEQEFKDKGMEPYWEIYGYSSYREYMEAGREAFKDVKNWDYIDANGNVYKGDVVVGNLHQNFIKPKYIGEEKGKQDLAQYEVREGKIKDSQNTHKQNSNLARLEVEIDGYTHRNYTITSKEQLNNMLGNSKAMIDLRKSIEDGVMIDLGFYDVVQGKEGEGSIVKPIHINNLKPEQQTAVNNLVNKVYNSVLNKENLSIQEKYEKSDSQKLQFEKSTVHSNNNVRNKLIGEFNISSKEIRSRNLDVEPEMIWFENGTIAYRNQFGEYVQFDQVSGKTEVLGTLSEMFDAKLFDKNGAMYGIKNNKKSKGADKDIVIRTLDKLLIDLQNGKDISGDPTVPSMNLGNMFLGKAYSKLFNIQKEVSTKKGVERREKRYKDKLEKKVNIHLKVDPKEISIENTEGIKDTQTIIGSEGKGKPSSSEIKNVLEPLEKKVNEELNKTETKETKKIIEETNNNFSDAQNRVSQRFDPKKTIENIDSPFNKEIGQIKQQIEANNRRKIELQNDSKQYKQYNRYTSRSINWLKDKIKEYDSEIKNNTSEIKDSELNLQKVGDKIASLNSRLGEKETELSTLQKVTKGNWRKFDKDVASKYREEIKSAKNEIKDLKSEIKDISSSRENFESKIDNLNRRNNSLTKKLNRHNLNLKGAEKVEFERNRKIEERSIDGKNDILNTELRKQELGKEKSRNEFFSQSRQQQAGPYTIWRNSKNSSFSVFEKGFSPKRGAENWKLVGDKEFKTINEAREYLENSVDIKGRTSDMPSYSSSKGIGNLRNNISALENFQKTLSGKDPYKSRKFVTGVSKVKDRESLTDQGAKILSKGKKGLGKDLPKHPNFGTRMAELFDALKKPKSEGGLTERGLSSSDVEAFMMSAAEKVFGKGNFNKTDIKNARLMYEKLSSIHHKRLREALRNQSSLIREKDKIKYGKVIDRLKTEISNLKNDIKNDDIRRDVLNQMHKEFVSSFEKSYKDLEAEVGKKYMQGYLGSKTANAFRRVIDAFHIQTGRKKIPTIEQIEASWVKGIGKLESHLGLIHDYSWNLRLKDNINKIKNTAEKLSNNFETNGQHSNNRVNNIMSKFKEILIDRSNSLYGFRDKKSMDELLSEISTISKKIIKDKVWDNVRLDNVSNLLNKIETELDKDITNRVESVRKGETTGSIERKVDRLIKEIESGVSSYSSTVGEGSYNFKTNVVNSLSKIKRAQKYIDLWQSGTENAVREALESLNLSINADAIPGGEKNWSKGKGFTGSTFKSQRKALMDQFGIANVKSDVELRNELIKLSSENVLNKPNSIFITGFNLKRKLDAAEKKLIDKDINVLVKDLLDVTKSEFDGIIEAFKSGERGTKNELYENIKEAFTLRQYDYKDLSKNIKDIKQNFLNENYSYFREKLLDLNSVFERLDKNIELLKKESIEESVSYLQDALRLVKNINNGVIEESMIEDFITESYYLEGKKDMNVSLRNWIKKFGGPETNNKNLSTSIKNLMKKIRLGGEVNSKDLERILGSYHTTHIPNYFLDPGTTKKRPALWDYIYAPSMQSAGKRQAAIEYAINGLKTAMRGEGLKKWFVGVGGKAPFVDKYGDGFSSLWGLANSKNHHKELVELGIMLNARQYLQINKDVDYVKELINQKDFNNYYRSEGERELIKEAYKDLQKEYGGEKISQEEFINNYFKNIGKRKLSRRVLDYYDEFLLPDTWGKLKSISSREGSNISFVQSYFPRINKKNKIGAEGIIEGFRDLENLQNNNFYSVKYKSDRAKLRTAENSIIPLEFNMLNVIENMVYNVNKHYYDGPTIRRSNKILNKLSNNAREKYSKDLYQTYEGIKLDFNNRYQNAYTMVPGEFVSLSRNLNMARRLKVLVTTTRLPQEYITELLKGLILPPTYEGTGFRKSLGLSLKGQLKGYGQSIRDFMDSGLYSVGRTLLRNNELGKDSSLYGTDLYKLSRAFGLGAGEKMYRHDETYNRISPTKKINSVTFDKIRGMGEGLMRASDTGTMGLHYWGHFWKYANGSKNQKMRNLTSSELTKILRGLSINAKDGKINFEKSSDFTKEYLQDFSFWKELQGVSVNADREMQLTKNAVIGTTTRYRMKFMPGSIQSKITLDTRKSQESQMEALKIQQISYLTSYLWNAGTTMMLDAKNIAYAPISVKEKANLTKRIAAQAVGDSFYSGVSNLLTVAGPVGMGALLYYLEDDAQKKELILQDMRRQASLGMHKNNLGTRVNLQILEQFLDDSEMQEIRNKYDLMINKKSVGDDIKGAFQTFGSSFTVGRYGTFGRMYVSGLFAIESELRTANMSDQEKREFLAKRKEQLQKFFFIDTERVKTDDWTTQILESMPTFASANDLYKGFSTAFENAELFTQTPGGKEKDSLDKTLGYANLLYTLLDGYMTVKGIALPFSKRTEKLFEDMARTPDKFLERIESKSHFISAEELMYLHTDPNYLRLIESGEGEKAFKYLMDNLGPAYTNEMIEKDFMKYLKITENEIKNLSDHIGNIFNDSEMWFGNKVNLPSYNDMFKEINKKKSDIQKASYLDDVAEQLSNYNFKSKHEKEANWYMFFKLLERSGYGDKKVGANVLELLQAGGDPSFQLEFFTEGKYYDLYDQYLDVNRVGIPKKIVESLEQMQRIAYDETLDTDKKIELRNNFKDHISSIILGDD